MTSLSIFISCTCATGVNSDLTPTNRVAFLAVRFMKTPVAFWPLPVARAQGSVTSTWAWAEAAASKQIAVISCFNMVFSFRVMCVQ